MQPLNIRNIFPDPGSMFSDGEQFSISFKFLAQLMRIFPAKDKSRASCMENLKRVRLEMFKFRIYAISLMMLMAVFVMGCANPGEPVDTAYVGGGSRGGDDPVPPPLGDQFLKNVVYDSNLGDLNDPEILAAATRGNLLIVDGNRFFGQPGVNEDLALIRATNPDIKVIGFFRNKTVRLDWEGAYNSYNADLFEASKPYWSYTTTGDTLQDWPKIANFSPLTAESRRAMLDVFVQYQDEAVNKLDGVFWDYFNFTLWLAPSVDSMDGEPDLDGDGIPHWDDADEIQAYQDCSVAWINEMREAMGDDFIQIVNGNRALEDSTFAGLVDGMFYETFPHVGFNNATGYIDALDTSEPNNLWAAHDWPRTQNGGPWLILSHMNVGYTYFDENYNSQVLDLADLNRAIALLVGGAAVYYDDSGRRTAGLPTVELDLGHPTSDVNIDGNRYSRSFDNGRIELLMGSGGLPDPFTFKIYQNETLVQSVDLPTVFP
jgi:hypothetical protein